MADPNDLEQRAPTRRERHRRRHSGPLTPARLDALAMAYVARFATSRHRLEAYLRRKLRADGWADEAGGSVPADAVIAAIADRCVRLGFVDDAAFAGMRARSMAGRGLGRRRISQQLTVDGIDADVRAATLDIDDDGAAALDAALAFARRRRLGPFARDAETGAASDPRQHQRAMAAFLRAGHSPAMARAILALPDDSAQALESLDAAALAR